MLIERKIAQEQGMKFYIGKPCKNCGNKKKYVSGSSCINCSKLRDTPEKRRKYYLGKGQITRYKESLKKLYNITVEQYNEMFNLQNGKCAICKKDGFVLDAVNMKQRNKRLHVDHDHETKQIRKLLCSHCNIALGYLKEDIEIMYSMIEYIKGYKAN